MKICLILEGSYPYTMGGVSIWVDSLIRSTPEHEYVLWAISDREANKGKFVFELPPNVVHVEECFLDSALKMKVTRNRNIHFTKEAKQEIEKLIRCQSPDWELLLRTFKDKSINPLELFMSEDFLTILKCFCEDEFPFAGFADLYWTIRSMFLPLLFLLTQPFPEADIYHSVSTGYAGVLGGLASIQLGKPYVLTEHGIYTREREEEILRADWVVPIFKELWISMFYMYSRFAYQQAWRVTSLFRRASLIQQDIGCDAKKSVIIGNGIDVERFSAIPAKKDNQWIDIAAIARVTPIKDIKTMIYTFSRLKEEVKNARLHILGGFEDDAAYYQECVSLIKFLEVKDILFAGVVDVPKYLENIDFTLLTSISEGQPFAILESMAAGRPLVATDVGSCRELIEGENDTFGPAGIFAPPMNQTELLNALIEMCRNKRMREEMGAAGRQRIIKNHKLDEMVNKYLSVYKKAVKSWQASVSN